MPYLIKYGIFWWIFCIYLFILWKSVTFFFLYLTRKIYITHSCIARSTRCKTGLESKLNFLSFWLAASWRKIILSHLYQITELRSGWVKIDFKQFEQAWSSFTSFSFQERCSICHCFFALRNIYITARITKCRQKKYLKKIIRCQDFFFFLM